MKLITILTMSCMCILIAGCAEEVQKGPDKALINAELMNSFNDIAMQNAIISQHTLYPYHFVNNSAKLNELGQRDLDVLTKHFMENPGQLNIRRHDISSDLYDARVNLVLDQLKEAGIATENISVSDGMPGGPGMPTERILIILEDSGKVDTTRKATTSTY